jgi:hypothetical protein
MSLFFKLCIVSVFGFLCALCDSVVKNVFSDPRSSALIRGKIPAAEILGRIP